MQNSIQEANMPPGPELTGKRVRTGYALVNGLQMYYEIHGTGSPLVLLHGAFSAIGTSCGGVLPGLAKTRQVIAFGLQAHGHTADIHRLMSLQGWQTMSRPRSDTTWELNGQTSSAIAWVRAWPCTW
jgi:pimeloyl-ACP methyl ester carboxylesterase